jgi:hypothetical protein
MKKQDRHNAISQLSKQAMLNKIAEETIEDVNQANIEDPQQFADHIFQELLNKMKIEGLGE